MSSFHSEQIALFQEWVLQRFGLAFDPSRQNLVPEILQARSAELKMNASEYLAALLENETEWGRLAELLTVPETYFFRGLDHFRVFEEVALPTCMAANSGARKINILSLGCASGEEPYTVAIVCEERSQPLAGWEVRIRGFDLSRAALDKARAGIFTDWSLRATSPLIRQKYFIKKEKRYRLKREIVESVEFDLGNVLQLYSEREHEQFDVVFFRNVLMYFSPEAAEAAVSQVAHVLKPGGYLFLGPAESLRDLSQDFNLCHTHDSFYYRRKTIRSGLIVRAPKTSGIFQNTSSQWSPNPAPDALVGLGDVDWFEAILQSGRRIEALGDRAAAKTETATTVPATSGPSNGEVDRAKLALMDLLRGECHDAAVSLIRSLPKYVTQHSDIRLLEAILVLNRGDFKKAEELCQILLSQNEMNATAHYVMALCRENRLDHDAAISHDRTAIYLDPGFAMPHLHIALIMKKRNDFLLAKREFVEAVRLLPQDIDGRLLLLGGGFNQRTLIQICEREIESLEAA